MEQLTRSVATVRRRLTVQTFLSILPWCLFGSLLVALAGLAIPKIWYLGWDAEYWLWSWLGGGLIAGVGLAMAITLWRQCEPLDAALELDRRCGFRERVSSALALTGDEQESDFGRALVKDASLRVEQVDVADAFQVAGSKRLLLPLLPVLAIVGLMFLPNATQETAQASTAAQVQKQIKKTTQELEKRLAKHKQRTQQTGLEDAEDLFKKLQQGLDEISQDQDVDRQKALLKMSDLAKEIEKRRNALGDSDKMKQQFSRLKELQRGPAEKVAGALKEGDFQKALEGLKDLSEKIKSGELSEEDKEKLVNQLGEMQQKLQEMVDAHQAAKEELKRQIEQKEREGDLEAAGRMQRQLDALEQMDRQMERMQQMADQLSQCQECMGGNDPAAAAAQLEQMAAELQDMQDEMDQLETLNEMMDEIAMAKDMMAGQPMDGFAPGMSPLDSFGDGMGDGMSEGQGRGYRPEQETETGEYQARERVKPRQGEAVRVGDAFGPNRAGMSREEVKQQILNSLGGEADPLTDQRLPKSQRDHVRQYYQRLTEGE